MKNSFYLRLLALFSLSLLLSACGQPSANQGPHKVVIGKNVWSVETVRTAEAQKQGLSDRASLATSTGMLFVFDQAAVKVFWMKNMRFPIDIVWIRDNKIVKIDEGLLPEGENPKTTYSSVEPVDMVLEINAWEALAYHLKVGNVVSYE